MIDVIVHDAIIYINCREVSLTLKMFQSENPIVVICLASSSNSSYGKKKTDLWNNTDADNTDNTTTIFHNLIFPTLSLCLCVMVMRVHCVRMNVNVGRYLHTSKYDTSSEPL